MGWSIVKQPNGKLARFSTIVDNFTDCNLTEEQALEVCQEYIGKTDAQKKVQDGVDDIKYYTASEKGDGLSRWKDCLETIVMQHGYHQMEKTLNENGLLEYLPAKDAFENNAGNLN